MKRRAIVNLVTNSERYIKGQQRLINSFNTHFDGSCELVTFVGEYSVNSELHIHNPYSFKVGAIEILRSRFDQILWLDASMVFVKPMKPIFDLIEKNGFFLEDSGWKIGTWTNDFALNYFGITRDDAMQMRMFSSGFTGIDFTTEIGCSFFDLWKKSMLAGCFKGTWQEHRHDQTCGSIIANQLGMDKMYSEGGTYFSYIGEAYGEPKETAICHLIGV
jgi:hypothetical protein